MKFTEEFRLKFEKALKESKSAFKEDCIEYVGKNITTPYRYVLRSLCYKNHLFELNYATVVEEISYLFSDTSNFDLQLRDDYTYKHSAFFNNEIKFLVPDGFPANDYWTDHYWNYVSKKVNFSYDCEADFWKNADNNEWYEAMSEFSCFLDIVIPISDIEKYKEIGDIVNVDAWLKYLRDLLKLYFPDFIFSEKLSTKKIQRFLKPLSESTSFGFEYDESLLRKRYQNGDLEFPEYFNLILLNNDFKKNAKKEDYIFKYSEDILSLGMLENPLFHVGGLSGFISVDRTYERGNPENTTFKYFREYVQLNDNEVQIVHTKGIGDKVKKHAFFYMDMLSHSSKSYLRFLENNILASMNSK